MAADLISDYSLIDGIETVSVFDVSGNTTDSSVSALAGNVTVIESSGTYVSAPDTKGCQWTLYAATISFVPAPGDKITDGGGQAWTVRSVETVSILSADYKYICSTTAQ
jgi:hypothetical protein